MTHIEQMIKDMCPIGVEWKKLAEVTYWDKRFNEVDRSLQPQIRKYHYYLANELEDLESPTGTVRILYTSNKIAYAEEDSVAENVVDAEIVAIPWGGNANIKYFKGKFITADNRIAVVRDPSVLSTKFVYYWLTKNQTEIDSYYRGAGIKHPSMLKVLSFEIPIPPLEIQKKIVECLDKFSALAAELQAELQKRRTQYEYYRTRLLTPPPTESNSADSSTDECNSDSQGYTKGIAKVYDWQWKTLGEVGEMIKGSGIQKSDFVDEGLPCIHYGQVHTYYGTFAYKTKSFVSEQLYAKSKKAHTGDLVIATTSEDVDACCKATAWLGDEDVAVSGDAHIFRHNQNPKYMAYLFQTEMFAQQKRRCATGAKVTRVHGDDMLKFRFPFPSLEEQERVVNFLDKFEVLLNSLSDGIPAEQILQQKRYEYYRDLLLTFDRKAV